MKNICERFSSWRFGHLSMQGIADAIRFHLYSFGSTLDPYHFGVCQPNFQLLAPVSLFEGFSGHIGSIGIGILEFLEN